VQKKKCIFLFVIQTVILCWILTDSETRVLIKQRVITADTAVFNGFFRRTFKGQHIPNIKQNIDHHAAGDYDWIGSDSLLLIAHALGPKLYGGANTLKTLNEGYKRGFRIFEVDVAITSDNYLVCYHGGEERDIDRTTYADYLKFVDCVGLAPLNFNQIVDFAKSHPDTYFVLDVKNRFSEAYIAIRGQIADSRLGKSFIPQVYRFEQLSEIRSGNFFAGEIFTSYRCSLTTAQILSAAQRYDVRVVTLTIPRFMELNGKKKSNVSILTHAVNDPLIASNLIKLGAKGIYTSYITKEVVPELFSPHPIRTIKHE
jgi:glycerophosphoryl diester phosphodiesterase